MKNDSLRIGIDLGGTKIEGLLLDPTGQEIYRQRIATPVGDYLGTIQAIKQLVGDLDNHTQGTRLASIGIGIPGTVSRETGLVKNANSVCLIGNPLHTDLEEALGRPVRLENDANCFTVSEATDGAAAGKAVVFGVIIGTGTGGGIAVNGKPVIGLNAISGEWGHNPLPWPKPEELANCPQCYCGKTGCIESFLAGPGLERDYSHHNGIHLSASEIAVRAEQGDPACLETLERYEGRLARSLATIINVLDPEAIVLGGGVSNIERLYKTVPVLLEEWVFSDSCNTPILKNHHGDSSGVRGAAWLWS